MTAPGSSPKTAASDFIPFENKNAVVLGDPIKDNTVTALIALGMEVWVTRRRVKTLENVLRKNGIPADQVESYMPTAEEQAELVKERDEFLHRVFGGLARPGGKPLTDIASGPAADRPKP